MRGDDVGGIVSKYREGRRTVVGGYPLFVYHHSRWDTVCLILSVFFFYDFIDDDENILISSPFTVFLCLSFLFYQDFVSMLCDDVLIMMMMFVWFKLVSTTYQ